MRPVIEIIAAAVAVIFGFRKSNKDLLAENAKLKDTVSDQAATIRQLQLDHENDSLNNQALIDAANAAEQAAAEASQRADGLQTQLDGDEAAAQELAAALNENPETPSVDTEFNTTDPGAPTEENSVDPEGESA